MKLSVSDRIFYAVNYLFLSLGAMICILPFLHVFSVSFSSHHAVTSGLVTFWPVDFTIDAYRESFRGTGVIPAFFNSVIITVFGVFFSLLCTILTAYPLSRGHFTGRKFFTMAIVFTMLFNGGLIPTFLLMKSLGLVDSYGALWLLNLVSAYNLLIMKSFFENIPSELDDAARIDGCGEMGMLFRIVLPLSMPMIATIGLFYAVYYWDLFQGVLVYITDTSKYNLVVLVQQIVQQNSLLEEVNRNMDGRNVQLVPEMIKAAGVMVLVLPILCVYPFLQRFFVKRVMIGAIKG